MTLTLLIDGDITAYTTAASAEKATDWGDGMWTLHADEDNARLEIDNALNGLQKAMGADRLVVALSDANNFRKEILPSYKSNRVGVRKPIILSALRQHIRDNFEVFERPNLEGDDVLGILATSTVIVKGEKIIVSIDKDLRTIPGKVLNLNHAHRRIAEGEIEGLPDAVVEVCDGDADLWHMTQTLMGDSTDGYSGCPGIGPKRAAAILEKADGDWWPAIVETFKKAGFGEQEALTQARVARILRVTDYDFKKKEPILWNPPQ